MLNKEQTCTFEASAMLFPPISLLDCRGVLKQTSLLSKFPTADVSLSKMWNDHKARQREREGELQSHAAAINPRPRNQPQSAEKISRIILGVFLVRTRCSGGRCYPEWRFDFNPIMC